MAYPKYENPIMTFFSYDFNIFTSKLIDLHLHNIICINAFFPNTTIFVIIIFFYKVKDDKESTYILLHKTDT